MNNSFIETWSLKVIEYRKTTIALTLLVIGLSFLPMKNLYFDNSNEIWFLDGDPVLKDFRDLKDKFDNAEYLIIGIEAQPDQKTVFDVGTLRMIAEMTEFLEDHELVTKVQSLSKYQYMRSEDDTLTTRDLIENIDELSGSEQTMSGLIEIMKKETMVHDSLVTEDLRHTSIYARSVEKQGTSDHHVALTRDFNQFMEDKGYREKGFIIRLMGDPYITERFMYFSMLDQSQIIPLAYSMILLLLFVSIRTVAGVVMPLVVIIGSVLVSVGLIGLFGWAFNMLNVILPMILMTISVCDAIHIVVEYYHLRHAGKTSKEAASGTIQQLWIPCFYTSLTTAIGFIAISVTDLAPLRELGIVAAMGVMVAFLISVTTLPALLSFVTARKTERLVEDGWVARVTHKLPDFTLKYSKPLSALTGVVLLSAIVMSSQIQVDANFVNYFKKDSDIRQSFDYFDSTYHGGMNMEFMLDSGIEGGVKNPQFLTQVLALQDYLEALENTGKANSMVDYVRKMNQSMHNDDPAWYSIPETRELVAQYFLLYELSGPEEDLSDMKTHDERFMRISLKVVNMPTSRLKKLTEKIRQHIDANFSQLDITITGNMVLFNRMDTYIQEGLVKSFSLAFVLILLCFFLLFKSIKYGLLSMIPCMLPILVAGSLMVILDVYLDFATMMVAAVTFGIAVDDTIHVMSRYINGRRAEKSRKQAVYIALTESGRPVMFTSFVLYCGFSTLLLSSFVPNVYFGIFGSTIIFLALVADLLLLPALIFLAGDDSEHPVAT